MNCHVTLVIHPRKVDVAQSQLVPPWK
jgi:hypothetical protein